MSQPERRLLSGNEAVALGAWLAGCRLAAAYPGTPSSEILPAFVECGRRLGGEVYGEWSTNEKVALEVAAGASLTGARALAAMKHVGLNVAADPLFTLAYTGVEGGLVIVTADDPGMHSSQNEQDNRLYARHAGVPILEPVDSQEALEFTRLAFELSERFDIPVLLRLTTRVAHGKTPVDFTPEREERPIAPPPRKPEKYVMMPAAARERHRSLLERLAGLAEWAETTEIVRELPGEGDVGFVTNGLTLAHLREVLPSAPILHLGIGYPLPTERVRAFTARFRRTVVVEELEPVVFEGLRAAGVEVERLGDEVRLGELNANRVAAALQAAGVPCPAPSEAGAPIAELPPRPPVLCPGCIHRAVFSVLRKLRVFVTGDIGCYTLAALPPLSTIHTCLAMGAGISQAHGISRASGGEERVVAVIGDSTFTHMGIPALVNAVYNGGRFVCLILDNETTAMTGGQEHPGTGRTLMGEPAPRLDFAGVARAIGVGYVREVEGVDLAATEAILREALAFEGPSVVVVKRPCPLRYRIQASPMAVEPERCIICRACLRIGCPAISLAPGEGGKPVIDLALCTGCGLCAQVCRSDAIHVRAEEGGAAE